MKKVAANKDKRGKDKQDKAGKLTRLPTELQVACWRPIQVAQIKRLGSLSREIAYAWRVDPVALDAPRHWPSATLALVDLLLSTTSTLLPTRDTDIKQVLLAIRKHKQHRYVLQGNIAEEDIDRIARRARIKSSEIAHAVYVQR
jgi:hypothetical protein